MAGPKEGVVQGLACLFYQAKRVNTARKADHFDGRFELFGHGLHQSVGPIYIGLMVLAQVDAQGFRASDGHQSSHLEWQSG
jgi:hypothetical protein